MTSKQTINDIDRITTFKKIAYPYESSAIFMSSNVGDHLIGYAAGFSWF